MKYKICFPNSITKEELPLTIYLYGAGGGMSWRSLKLYTTPNKF